MGAIITSIHKQREALQDATGQWHPT